MFDWLGAVWQHLVDVRTFLLMRHLTKEHHCLLLSIFTLCVGCQRCVVENGAETCIYERILVLVLNFLFFGADKFKYCKSLWNPWVKNSLSKSEFSLTKKLKRTPQKDRKKSEICTFDMLQTDYCANALLAKTKICSSYACTLSSRCTKYLSTSLADLYTFLWCVGKELFDNFQTLDRYCSRHLVTA